MTPADIPDEKALAALNDEAGVRGSISRTTEADSSVNGSWSRRFPFYMEGTNRAMHDK